jgi:hypothetical protein
VECRHGHDDTISLTIQGKYTKKTVSYVNLLSAMLLLTQKLSICFMCFVVANIITYQFQAFKCLQHLIHFNSLNMLYETYEDFIRTKD